MYIRERDGSNSILLQFRRSRVPIFIRAFTLCRQMAEPQADRRDISKAEEASGSLVVSGGDPLGVKALL